MAIISSSSDFSRGGGVTWDDGFIWKVSGGLVGGLGMRMEYWASMAPGTAGTSSSTTKSKKNRRQLRSTVNISNSLSSSSTTDPSTTTIINVPVSGGGGSAGAGAAEVDVCVSCFGSSSARFFETVRNCGMLVVGYLLWVVLSVGKVKGRIMARSKKAHVGRVVRTKKRARPSLTKLIRALRWKLWSWARLAVLTPWVFIKELWFSYFIATHYSEDYFETGIYNRGIGGITLVPLDGMAGEGGRAVERGRGRGSGGGKKVQKPSVVDRVSKAVNDKISDLKLTLNALFALVGCLFCGLAWVFLLPENEVGRRISASRITRMADLASSEEDEDDSNHQGSDGEGSGKNGKDKKSPKKVDNAGGQRRKGGGRGGGGGKKKGKKR